MSSYFRYNVCWFKGKRDSRDEAMEQCGYFHIFWPFWNYKMPFHKTGTLSFTPHLATAFHSNLSEREKSRHYFGKGVPLNWEGRSGTQMWDLLGVGHECTNEGDRFSKCTHWLMISLVVQAVGGNEKSLAETQLLVSLACSAPTPLLMNLLMYLVLCSL